MLDYVTDDLPDAGNDVIAQHLKLVAREICATSRLWRHYPDAIDVSTSDPEISVCGVARSEVCAVINARLSGSRLEPTAPADAEANGIDKTGAPQYCWCPQPDVIRLYPIPSADSIETLVLAVALRPKLSADSVPAWIFENHILAFKAGVRASLMRMKDKPWSSPAEALRSQMEFDLLVGNITAESSRGRMASKRTTVSQYL